VFSKIRLPHKGFKLGRCEKNPAQMNHKRRHRGINTRIKGARAGGRRRRARLIFRYQRSKFVQQRGQEKRHGFRKVSYQTVHPEFKKLKFEKKD